MSAGGTTSCPNACSVAPNDRSRSSGSGTWQLGADWGEVERADAYAVLDAAVESGVTFFDTADVYGDGRSEQLIGRYLADHPDLVITVATKMGRRATAGPGELHPGQLPRLDRSVPAQPGRRPSSTWSSCTARRPRSTPTTRSTTRWTPWSPTA